MERTEETLKARVRETPLPDRLNECRKRIGKMCAEGRAPRMCIPVQHDDDDFFICTTLDDAQATVEALQAIIKQMGEQACVLAKDGMAAKAQVEALQRERDKLREATKVICGHCCEPMAIPSKAILQSQLSALRDERDRLREALKALVSEVGSYTVERQYYSREEASKDLDRREKALLTQLQQAKSALTPAVDETEATE